MKKLNYLILIFIISCSSQTLISQESKKDFSEVLDTYYLEKDINLIENTIKFLNDSNNDYDNLEPLITGFYGALFLKYPEIKKEFKSNIEKIKEEKFRNLIITLTTTNIKNLMNKFPISPSYNDMNWSAFFSTGENKYLELILNNTPKAENRIDLNLFLTGASAKWSLCSNANQHKKVKYFLETTSNHKEIANEILNSYPVDFRNQLVEIIKEQRSKGIWN